MPETKGDLIATYTLRVPEWAKLPISVDIESVGLADSAPIFAIGAVRFTEDGSPLPEDCPGEFYELINLKGQGPVDVDTLSWWLGQPDEARAELAMSQHADQLYKVLRRFHEWLIMGHARLGMTQQVFEGRLWVRGNRDSAWLEHAYKSCGMPLPYRYHNVGDQRTLVGFAQSNLHIDAVLQPRETVMHHALHDARYQAECLQAVFKRYPTLE